MAETKILPKERKRRLVRSANLSKPYKYEKRGEWQLNHERLTPPRKTKGLNDDEPVNGWLPRYEIDILREAKSGVSGSRIKDVASLGGLTNREIAVILQISERSLQRIKPEQTLDVAMAERLLLLENVLTYGIKNVFPTHSDEFFNWLRTEQPAFEDTPLAVMQNTLGFNLVMEKLGQMDLGLY